MTSRVIANQPGGARWGAMTVLEVGGIVLDVGAATDCGTTRTLNEDGFAIGPATVMVIDGSVGGFAGVIARQQALVEALAATDADAVALLRAVDAAMVRKATPELRGMSATAAAVSFVGDQVVVAHIGDCRVLRCRDGVATALTRDHSLRNAMVDAGQEIPADFAFDSVITRALGATPDKPVEVDRTTTTLEPGDRLILCSDGVHRHLDVARLAELCIVDDLQRAAEQIVAAAIAAGSTDNLTVALVAR